MKLINYLLENNLDDLTSKNPQPGVYPESTIDNIRKLIRQGVKPNKETGQHEKWGNALHVVHKAFEVATVQRPTPDMKDMWKQYEELIAFAVQELSKEHGINGDWRMTAAEFHEAYNLAKNKGIKVQINEEIIETFVTDANKVYQTLADMCRDHNYEMKPSNNGVVTFWKHGIKQKHYVKILHPLDN